MRIKAVIIDKNSASIKINLLLSICELEKILGFKSDSHHKKPYHISVKPIHFPEHNQITIGRIGNNIKFEVRSEESHHNTAHFHITICGAGSGSYRIDNLEPITTNINSSTEKELLKWASHHRQELVKVWNKFHGYRITVA